MIAYGISAAGMRPPRGNDIKARISPLPVTVAAGIRDRTTLARQQLAGNFCFLAKRNRGAFCTERRNWKRFKVWSEAVQNLRQYRPGCLTTGCRVGVNTTQSATYLPIAIAQQGKMYPLICRPENMRAKGVHAEKRCTRTGRALG